MSTVNLKFILFFLVFGAVLINQISAQTRPKAVKAKQKFSVSCAKALRIGADAVENLHTKEMQRRTKGATDSGTESDATENALRNYTGCRRADSAAKLKTFSAADTIAEVKDRETAARKLARARFDGLIYGVAWDEKGEDSINHAMTLQAVALLEDYKGALIDAYSMDVEPNADEAEESAARDEKLIRERLARIKNRSFENAEDAAEYQTKFAALQTAVNRFLQEKPKLMATEKAIVTNFILKLLSLGASEE